jgi:hypothetical protein
MAGVFFMAFLVNFEKEDRSSRVSDFPRKNLPGNLEQEHRSLGGSSVS